MRAHSRLSIFTFPPQWRDRLSCPCRPTSKRRVIEITSTAAPQKGHNAPSGTGECRPPTMPGHSFTVPADLTGAPAPPAPPGCIEVHDRAVVARALPQTRPRDGVGEQFHGVPGDRAEQCGEFGRPVQLPYERAVFFLYGAGGRGRGAGEVVDAGEREVVRGAGLGGRESCTYQLSDVSPEFTEPHEPGGVRVRERGARRYESGSGDPGEQHLRRIEPFDGMGGREEVEADPSGVEPQLVRDRGRTQCHVPVTA